MRRACTFGPVLLALAFAPGCAARTMRAQAAALADAGARLERETAEFTAARTAVVQLRQRNLVERRAQIAEQGQFNARTVHFWKIAGDEGRSRRLALFDGVVAASEAMAAVQDRPLEWEDSVRGRASALTIDRAALHRFTQQLLLLSRPGRFLDQARFYLEYGVVVSAQVEAGLKEVQGTVAAAQAAQGPGERVPPPSEPPPERPDPPPTDPVVRPRGDRPPGPVDPRGSDARGADPQVPDPGDDTRGGQAKR